MAVAGIVAGGLSILMLPVSLVIVASILTRPRVSGCQVVPAALLRGLAGAQNMYRRNDYDNDGIFEYAYPYTVLNTQKDSEGRPIKLIDDAFPNASIDNPPGGKTIPRAGYLYIDLLGDEGGEDYDDGKGNFVKGYGLCAVPETYGKTGRNTYVINVMGTVYMKDTGGKPLRRFPDVAAEGWATVGG